VTGDARTKAVVFEVVDRSTTILRISGDLDAVSVSEAAPLLMQFRHAPSAHLHIDATGSGFIDSTGLSALAMVADAVRRRGGEVTSTASERAARLIELCGLTSLVGYTPTPI
jgi:anti-anti-sigma factor